LFHLYRSNLTFHDCLLLILIDQQIGQVKDQGHERRMPLCDINDSDGRAGVDGRRPVNVAAAKTDEALIVTSW